MRTVAGMMFPTDGRNWVWGWEADLAREWVSVRGGELDFLECLVIEPRNFDARPFAWVAEMYERRAQWKREGRGAEKVLKLGLNSLYGKMAQQLGGIITAEGIKPPPYFSLTWAGMVTSQTRAALGRAALTVAPGDVLLFMTDAVYTTVPLTVTEGTALGEWEREMHDEIVIVQPGVYWLRDDGKWTSKVRGFNRETLRTPAIVLTAWKNKQPNVIVPTTRFVTSGTALASEEAWKTWRTWQTEPRELDLWGGSPKRASAWGSSVRPHCRMVPLAQARNEAADHPPIPHDVAFWRGARVTADPLYEMIDELELGADA
jgi:hypothetical protein